MRKFFSLGASAILVLLISGLISLKPMSIPEVKASHSANCADIQKSTNTSSTFPVASPGYDGTDSGVADSGQMDFSVPDASTSYHACVERSHRPFPPAENASRNFWNGWVWNNNLGYMSFLCEAGSNAGAPCGSVTYNTYTDLSGAVWGFAWADNFGWISMGCDGATGQNDGFNCGTTSYGVKSVMTAGFDPSTDPSIPLDQRVTCVHGDGGPLEVGDLYGYAWNDSVGWINFCGARSRFTYTADVSITKVSMSTGTELDQSATMYANGDDAYEVRAQLYNEDGTVVSFEGDPAYRVSLVPSYMYDYANDRTWYIRTDQITPCEFPADTDCIATKQTAGGFIWDAGAERYYMRTSSIAPSDADANRYIFAALTVLIYDTNGTTGDENDDRVLYQIAHTITGGYEFAFTPAIEVTQIESEESPGLYSTDSIDAIANTTQRVRLTAARPGSQGILPDNSGITISGYMYDCSDQYEFVFDAAGDGLTDGVDINDTPSPAPDRGNPSETNTFYCSTITPTEDNPRFADVIGTTLDSFGNPEIPFTSAQGSQFFYTSAQAGGSNAETSNAIGYDTSVSYDVLQNPVGTVSYGSPPYTVRYMSRRLTSSSVLSQAADVRGDVSIDIRSTTGLPTISERIAQSIGERAQSKREPVYRIVRSQLSGRTAAGFPVENRNLLKSADLVSTTANKGIIYYKRDRAARLAAPCTLVLNGGSGSDMDVTGAVTLVTEGCNIYIDSNIRPTSSTGRLGIIALEDLTMSGNLRGGNVYICSQVTDIEANFVLDGSLFSYGNTLDCGDPEIKTDVIDRTTGYPIFTRSVREILRNQLTIIGSLVSNNTYGGSLQTPPLMGTGEVAIGDQVAAARLYDLNFLRYAHTVMDQYGQSMWATETTGGATINLSQELLDPTGTQTPLEYGNNPDQRGIVNIIFQQVSKDAPILNAL